MTLRPIDRCRICSGILEHRADDTGLYDPAISRCQSCDTRQLNVVVEEQTELYPTFDQKHGAANVLLDKLLSVFYLERRRVMRSAGIPLRRNSGRRILDVGCGTGDFLNHMEPYFEVSGQEPFSFNTRKHPHLTQRIFQGGLDDLPFPDESFDVVTFWHSLEHMENAPVALQKAVRLLKDDGYLLISIPNVDSLQARVFRSRWFHLVIPRHVFHFSRATLTRLLATAGLEPTHFGTLSMEYGVSGWVQSFLNILFEKDLFYEWVKNRGEFERSGSRAKTAKVAVSLVMAAVLTPVFVVAEIVAGAGENGAVMNLVAQKRR